jgi:hypothetical protein
MSAIQPKPTDIIAQLDGLTDEIRKKPNGVSVRIQLHVKGCLNLEGRSHQSATATATKIKPFSSRIEIIARSISV